VVATASAGGYDLELATALRAVTMAARLCGDVAGELEVGVLSKDDRSPVTVADFGSQAIVNRELAAAFPADPVMAEEDSSALRVEGNDQLLAQVIEHVSRVVGASGEDEVCGWIDRGNLDATRDRYWVLDPIDGTKGFLRGDQYAIALALIDRGELRVAALACPEMRGKGRGALFFATKGGGAWETSLESPGDGERIRVSDVSDPRVVRLCEPVEPSHSHHALAAQALERLAEAAPDSIQGDGDADEVERPAPVRLDSQAKYGAVAAGDAELYLRLPTSSDFVERVWDHAAGVLIVEGAGGSVTDALGQPLDFSHGTGLASNRGVVATNGLVHDAVISALAQLLEREQAADER